MEGIKQQDSPSILSRLKPHIELIAALFSGVLILFAWFFGIGEESSLSITLYLAAFLIGGFAQAKEGILNTIHRRELNVELLMIFAAIGSSVIGYWAEGAILIFIFSLSGALETYTMNKSKKELSSLMNLQPEEAWLLDANGQSNRVLVNTLEIGNRLLVKPGDRIPVDGVIVTGSTSIDEAAISGESIPVSKHAGDELFAGTVNLNGVLTIEMTKSSSESLVQKIIELVQSAQSEKSPSQQFIERFEGKYVKIVLITVGLMMFLPHYIFDWDWTTTFYRAMVLLVVASPCALVASIMPATLAAISNGAKNGLLFKGGVHLENIGNMKAIALDKTGTLTQGKPLVTDFIVRDGLDEQAVLTSLASIESQSTHPLAQAITSFAITKGVKTFPITKMEDIPGWGIKADIDLKEWKVGKPRFVGYDEAMSFSNDVALHLENEGKTVIFAADQDGIIAVLALKDTVRPESKEAISLLRKAGIYTIMLTGDNERTAKVIAEEAGVDHYIAECLPETKVTHMKDLLAKYGNVGMVGDGINDAPALATATLGIAMGQGTDVALETADVVLMKDDLSRITYAIHLSRKMNRVVKQNVIFSISIIVLLIFSNFFQIINLPLGVIGHEGSTILVILNGLRLLKIK
ncbi:heavy metal translocating P-type ATPase [Paenisporosarcina antarctica]|uniref:P-type Cu(+) transporter n=1 Tax=Paenisporosarcina antarctica TaxID=417367 RepID=A0A4P6ZY17_9BACL|nr:heavy metal translocating P-type ATPase [Paenisporosarcina antarctica]QBP40356.1 cadmium-translocating P-type ATPase [Paenisporosarcina antarctica]